MSATENLFLDAGFGNCGCMVIVKYVPYTHMHTGITHIQNLLGTYFWIIFKVIEDS